MPFVPAQAGTQTDKFQQINELLLDARFRGHERREEDPNG
jgi:hypothetical protein